MKKLLTILYLLSIIKSTAQNSDYSHFLGINAGPNISTLKGNDRWSFDPLPGISVGIPYSFYLPGQRLGLHFAPMIEMRRNYGPKEASGGWNGPTQPITSPRTYEPLYLTIPLSVSIGLGNEKLFYIEAGYYFSNHLKHIDEQSDYTIYFNKKDAGILGAMGLRIPISKKQEIQLKMRYMYSPKMVNDRYTLFHRNFSILVNWNFRLN